MSVYFSLRMIRLSLVLIFGIGLVASHPAYADEVAADVPRTTGHEAAKEGRGGHGVLAHRGRGTLPPCERRRAG